MPTLFTITANQTGSHLLLTSIPGTRSTINAKVILQSMKMVFLCVRWAYVCIMMVSKNPNTAKNTVVLLQIAKMDVNVRIHVLTPNMEEPSIFSKRTIQDYLTYRHGTVHNGKQSTTNAPLLKDLTNVKR